MFEMKPVISIIVPFYNVESFIAECIESVLTQNLEELELILVDDASQDTSRDICEYYAKDDRRVKIVTHPENRGLGPARNTGVEAVEAPYLFFLDSDDRLTSRSSVHSVIKAAHASGEKMVAASAQAIVEGVGLKPHDRMFERNYKGRIAEKLTGSAAYCGLIRMPGSNYMPLRSWGYLLDTKWYRRSGILHPSGPHEDIGHNALLATCAGTVMYHRDIVVDYRLRPGSISRSQWTNSKVDGYLKVWRHFCDHHDSPKLSHMRGNAALHAFRNALWMLERNGIAIGYHEYVLSKLSEILVVADSKSNAEMVASVLRIAKGVFPKIGLGAPEFERVFGKLPTDTALNAARHEIGIYEVT